MVPFSFNQNAKRQIKITQATFDKLPVILWRWSPIFDGNNGWIITLPNGFWKWKYQIHNCHYIKSDNLNLKNENSCCYTKLEWSFIVRTIFLPSIEKFYKPLIYVAIMQSTDDSISFVKLFPRYKCKNRVAIWFAQGTMKL
jgi:hypothetical protein